MPAIGTTNPSGHKEHGALYERMLANQFADWRLPVEGSVARPHAFSLDELNSRIRLESQASEVAGRHYRKLYLDGEVRRGGYLQIDTLLVDIDTVVNGTIDEKTGAMA